MNPQNTASHGGLLGGLEEEEESLDEASLPVPVDLEDRNAYEGIGGLLQGRKLRIPKFRPPSFVGGGGLSPSPSAQRKVQGGSEGQTLISSSIAEHRCVMSCARVGGAHGVQIEVSLPLTLTPHPYSSPLPSPELPPLADTFIENGPYPSLPTDTPLRPNRLSGKNITNRLRYFHVHVYV